MQLFALIFKPQVTTSFPTHRETSPFLSFHFFSSSASKPRVDGALKGEVGGFDVLG